MLQFGQSSLYSLERILYVEKTEALGSIEEALEGIQVQQNYFSVWR